LAGKPVRGRESALSIRIQHGAIGGYAPNLDRAEVQDDLGDFVWTPEWPEGANGCRLIRLTVPLAWHTSGDIAGGFDHRRRAQFDGGIDVQACMELVSGESRNELVRDRHHRVASIAWPMVREVNVRAIIGKAFLPKPRDDEPVPGQ
jgi:hypothetical protein